MARQGELIVMARPSLAIHSTMAESLGPVGLQDKAGNRLVARHNLHQSFSCIHPPGRREVLRNAISTTTAHAFALQFDAVRSVGSDPGDIHLQFIDSGKMPDGFAKFQADLHSAFDRHGIEDRLLHSVHITLSYWTQQRMQKVHVRPVLWIIDTIELVEVKGHGDTYRYESLDSWRLLPMTESPAFQPDLLT